MMMRSFPKILLSLTANVLFFLLVASAGAQTPAPSSPEAQRGIDLYARGLYREAIDQLKVVTKANPADADAWHTLGLSYFGSDDLGKAQSAFERAIKLRPNFAPSHVDLAYVQLMRGKLDSAGKEAATAVTLDNANATAHYILAAVASRRDHAEEAVREATEALRLKPDLGPALLVKSEASFDIYYRELEAKTPKEKRVVYLDDAIAALDEFFRLNPKEPNTEYWQDQLLALRLERQRYGGTDVAGLDEIHSPSTVQTKAKIIRKPPPVYPESARMANVTGTVRLRAVLSATGRVTGILVLNSLEPGLTRAAIDAAKAIKFVPATINGKPVSQYAVFEYNFLIF
jgi:TonB family protein